MYMYRYIWDKPLGQAQPVGQADLDRLCLSQWDRHAACTKPVPLGLGPERSKETCPGPMDRSYTHAGVLSLSQDQPYAHDGTCPSPTCPNLSHKVGLQGREQFVPILKKSCQIFFTITAPVTPPGITPGQRWVFPKVFRERVPDHMEEHMFQHVPVPFLLFPQDCPRLPPFPLYLWSETPAKKYFPPKRKMVEESPKEEGW